MPLADMIVYWPEGVGLAAAAGVTLTAQGRNSVRSLARWWGRSVSPKASSGISLASGAAVAGISIAAAQVKDPPQIVHITVGVLLLQLVATAVPVIERWEDRKIQQAAVALVESRTGEDLEQVSKSLLRLVQAKKRDSGAYWGELRQMALVVASSLVTTYSLQMVRATLYEVRSTPGGGRELAPFRSVGRRSADRMPVLSEATSPSVFVQLDSDDLIFDTPEILGSSNLVSIRYDGETMGALAVDAALPGDLTESPSAYTLAAIGNLLSVGWPLAPSRSAAMKGNA